MIYQVGGIGNIEINTIVFDLNGTLQVNGAISPQIKPKLKQLSQVGIELIIFTGDARGNAANIADDLCIDFIKTANSKEKEKEFLKFDTNTTAAVGNARIDIGMFKHARVSVATLQAEGIHTDILKYVDILVPRIEDALDFFIDKKTFNATMRK